MPSFKLVPISKDGFAFCRLIVAALAILSLLPTYRWLLWIVFVIMVWSVLSRVQKSPLVLLYKYTVERVFPSEQVTVDEHGIFFAQILAAIFALLCLFLPVNSNISLALTGLFAALQIAAAFGFCSAIEFYNYMTKGNHWPFGSKTKDLKKNKGSKE